jgi:hypothetical protein
MHARRPGGRRETVLDHPVFVKTPKGIDEVERRTHGLPLKSRQVLIMIDGRRDVAALKDIFPPEMAGPVVAELLASGFIRELAPAASSAPVTKPDQELQPMKEAFSSALYDVFGPDADNFTRHVDAAKSRSDLVRLAEKYEQVVTRMGGRTKAEAFASRLRAAGIDFTPAAAAGPRSQLPAAPAPAVVADLRPLKESMTRALFEYFGPDADAFSGKVDAATSVGELEALAKKYAEVVAGMGGKKKALAFLARLSQAGLDVAAPMSVPSSMPVSRPVVDVAVRPSPAAVAAPRDDAERLDMARQFMINTANSLSGLTGSSLIVELNQAKNLKQLRALFYDWREALQLSATGRQRLPDLEQRLAALLS